MGVGEGVAATGTGDARSLHPERYIVRLRATNSRISTDLRFDIWPSAIILQSISLRFNKAKSVKMPTLPLRLLHTNLQSST